MAIVADIEDLAPAEFLLLLSLANKSGKLSVVQENRKVLLALREGSIVYAASPRVRERIGSMLVNRGLVSQGELNTALKMQREGPPPRMLGPILVEMGAVSQAALREVVKSQFEAVITALLDWERGVMVFENLEIPDLGAIAVDPADVLVAAGADTDHLLVRRLAELDRAHGFLRDPNLETGPVSPVLTGPWSQQQSAPRPVQTADRVRRTRDDDRAATRELLEEMESLSVALTAEMTLAILGSAAEVAERGVLFLVSPERLEGIGGFGRDSGGGTVTARNLWIPRALQSVFTRVVEAGVYYRGPLECSEGDWLLIDVLGGVPPGDAVVVPLVVRDTVVAVLYADGGAEGRDIGPMDPLGHAMSAVARALEERHRVVVPDTSSPVPETSRRVSDGVDA